MKKLNFLHDFFGWALIISWATFIGAFLVWAWVSWDLAWRIGLSSIAGMLFFGILSKSTTEAKEAVSNVNRNSSLPPKRSAFAERLESMRQKQNEKTP